VEGGEAEETPEPVPLFFSVISEHVSKIVDGNQQTEKSHW
jgi:hypothetical protein